MWSITSFTPKHKDKHKSITQTEVVGSKDSSGTIIQKAKTNAG